MSNDSSDIVKAIYVVVLMLGGVCVLGWQGYHYLRYNEWISVSLITALEIMNIRWAFNPTDWLGLYNVLKAIPLSVTMFVVGWVTLMNE